MRAASIFVLVILCCILFVTYNVNANPPVLGPLNPVLNPIFNPNSIIIGDGEVEPSESIEPPCEETEVQEPEPPCEESPEESPVIIIEPPCEESPEESPVIIAPPCEESPEESPVESPREESPEESPVIEPSESIVTAPSPQESPEESIIIEPSESIVTAPSPQESPEESIIIEPSESIVTGTSPGESIIIEPSESIVTAPSESIVTEPSESIVIEPSESIVTVPSESVIIEPSESIVTAPSESIVTAPSESVTIEPSESIVTVPSESIVTAPSESIVTAPSESIVTAPSESIVTAPSESIVTAPSESIVTAPSESIVTAPSESIVTAPSESIVTAPSESIVTAPSESIVTAPSESIVTAPSESIVTAPSESIVTAPSESIVTAPSESIVTAPSESIVNAPSESIVTAPSESIVTAPSESIVTAPSESIVTAPSESIVTAPSESIVTAPSESIVTAPSESIVTAPSESFVTEPSESVIIEPSESIVFEPSESIVTAPSESIVTSPSKSIVNPPSQPSASGSDPPSTGPGLYLRIRSNIPVSGLVSRSRPVQLFAIVEASGSIKDKADITWTAIAGGQKGVSVDLTPYVDNQQLLIPQGVLLEGTQYLIKVRADAGNSYAIKYVQFQVGSTPVGPDPTVSPSKGSALTTSYTLAVGNWVDTAGSSLTYTYYFKSKTQGWIRLNSQSTQKLTTVLSAGDSNNGNILLLKLAVSNSAGTVVEKQFSTIVTPISVDDTIDKLKAYVFALDASDPELLNKLSIVAGALSGIDYSSLTQAQLENLRAIILRVLQLLATFTTKLVSSIDSSHTAKLAIGIFEQIMGIVVSCSNPVVITSQIRELLIQIPSTLLSLTSEKMEAGTFSFGLLDNIASVIDNVAVYSGGKVFRSDLKQLVDTTLDRTTQTADELAYQFILSKLVSGFAAVGGLKTAVLGQTIVTSSNGARSIQAATPVAVSVNSIVSESLAGDFATVQSTTFGLPPYEFVENNQLRIGSVTVTPRVIDQDNESDDSYKNWVLNELVTIAFPVSSYDSTKETPQCSFYSTVENKWDNSTCTVAAKSSSSVSCSCERFGPVLVSFRSDSAVTSPTKDSSKKRGMTKGGIAALVVVLSVAAITVAIIAAIVVGVIVWYRVKKSKKDEDYLVA